MTNPDNIVRVRARNGGRASVYEANAWAQGFSAGLFEGNGAIQNTSADMNVLVGGSATKPDVLLATNPAGYKIALDLVGQQAVAITAPASNSRISAIVAYTNDLSIASTQTNITGSPASCGLIVVNGSTASSPVEPTDAQIRSAITADGATGSQAAYCVIATIKVASGTTVINNALITNRIAEIDNLKIGVDSITSDKIDFTTFGEQFETEHTITGGKVRIARFGKVGFFSGISDTVSYSGTFTTKVVSIPGSLLPNGTIILLVQATTVAHTVDDNQMTHGMAGSVVSGSGGRSYSFPIMSTISAQKACAVAFFFPVIFPD